PEPPKKARAHATLGLVTSNRRQTESNPSASPPRAKTLTVRRSFRRNFCSDLKSFSVAIAIVRCRLARYWRGEKNPTRVRALLCTLSISLSGSAIVNGTKSYTVSDAAIQSPNAAVSALKSGGGEGVNKMRANGPACLPPYCRFLFPAPQSSAGPRATPSATRTFSRPGYRLAIDGPSGPDFRAIYG